MYRLHVLISPHNKVHPVHCVLSELLLPLLSLGWLFPLGQVCIFHLRGARGVLHTSFSKSFEDSRRIGQAARL